MAKENKFFLTTMVGTKGRVMRVLNPEGMVRIHGELWQAKAASAPINPGEEITVVEQDGLTLTVARSTKSDTKGTYP
jgi:membrane-bound serine protease (ClpP class)